MNLFRYLDNENMLKVDLLIPSPQHAVSQDVTQFYEMYEKIMKTMGELETIYQNKDLLKILKKIPDLVQFRNQYKRVEYLNALQNKDEHENFIF